MIFFDLFFAFFKIGLFSFGGGYAMIPLISEEIANHGWMNEAEFLRIIGIAEMTPGSIAINAATFIGFQTAGLPGALVASLGVLLPSLLIILFISAFFFKYSRHPLMKKIFSGIRPVVTGLIFSAGLLIAKEVIFEIRTLIVFLALLVLIKFVKIHPIMLIVLAAGGGVIVNIF